MKVTELARGTRRVDIDVEGTDEKVAVHYRPAALTTANVARMTDPGTTDEESREILSSILESWEIEAEDGSQLGTSPEEIGTIPLEFIAAVITGIVTKATVPEGSGGTSSST